MFLQLATLESCLHMLETQQLWDSCWTVWDSCAHTQQPPPSTSLIKTQDVHKVSFAGRCLHLKCLFVSCLQMQWFHDLHLQRKLHFKALCYLKRPSQQPWKSVLIYPIPFSSVTQLIFVRGCNWQCLWHIPLLIACTLPQHPAPSRRKHSSSSSKQKEAFLCHSKIKQEDGWEQSPFMRLHLFTVLLHIPLCTGWVEKGCPSAPVWPSPGCTNSPAPKRKEVQKEIWQHKELGQPKEGAQPECPWQGWMTMSLGVLRAGGQRVQQGRAPTNGISATLTQLLFSWCHGRSAPTCPQSHRNGEASVSFHSQSSSSHLWHMNCNTLSRELVHWAQSSLCLLMLLFQVSAKSGCPRDFSNVFQRFLHGPKAPSAQDVALSQELPHSALPSTKSLGLFYLWSAPLEKVPLPT